MLRRVAHLDKVVNQVKRGPGDESDDTDLHEEERVDKASVEVLLQKDNAHKVDDARCDLDQKHLEAHIVDLQ